jgi:hypothetical protein
VGLIISSEKILIFSEEIMMAWIFFSENQEALMLSFPVSLVSLFLLENNQSHHYFFRKKAFFFEEITMRLFFI